MAFDDPDLAVVLGAVQDFLAGGKRLRPAFAYWGWRGRRKAPTTRGDLRGGGPGAAPGERPRSTTT